MGSSKMVDGNSFTPEELADMFRGTSNMEDRTKDRTEGKTEDILNGDREDEIIQKISRVTGMKYSDEQLEILKHRGGMNILACAGSGKTTVLTHLLAKRVMSGEIQDTSKLLCTTYSRAGAVEMEERINNLFKKLGILSRVTVKTLHAFYLMVLKRFGIPTDVIDNGTRMRYILESCREVGVVLEDEDLQVIDSLLSYQVNNLMSDKDLVRSYVFILDNINEQQFTRIRMGYNRRKQAAGLIDFDDMQLYMYTLLVQQKREDIINYCRTNWTDFYIDEAQDVSRIQFEILKPLIVEDDKLVFIGDDDQAIYQWRGADPTIIQNIDGYFNIRRFKLTTNYRCKSNIVRPAAVGIKNNARRSEKTMKAYEEGGRVRICDTGGGDLYNQSKYAFVHIKNLIEKEGVNPEDIAVLSRNNRHLAILSNMLFKEGIYCETTRDMRFTGNSMYRDIRNVMEIANNTINHNITASTLWRMCSYLGTRRARTIAEFQNAAGLRIGDALGYILSKHPSTDIEWEGVVRVPATVEGRIEDFLYRTDAEIIKRLELIYGMINEKDERDRLRGLLYMYLQGSSFMYGTQDRQRTIEGFIMYTLDIVDRAGIENTKSFFRASEQYESGNVGVLGGKVCMTTMHSAKGREWEHVILFADDNVAFPSFEGIDNMCKTGVSLSDISASIDEDRRLHYVAMTRAKSDLTIFTDSSNVSVYTLEALKMYTPNIGESNAHIIKMARNGSLYEGLIKKTKEQIFGVGSEYLYEINIDNIDTSSGLGMYAPDEDDESVGISLDSIAVGNYVVHGDD